LSWFQNGEIWVPKWGNLGAHLGMVTSKSEPQVLDALSYGIISQMGAPVCQNEEHWVHTGPPWVHSESLVVGSQQVTQG
jgi:hypothetical protein